jgi:ParB/RepB/Spo0J family partition protein
MRQCTEILEVEISAIDANPYRLLKDYPFVENKIEALKRSFADVGMWPGVIARRAGNRFQIAFGHHRIEAARQNKLKRVALIVQELDDEKMLQFMGRENMEDYNADFLCMLETWEAAVSFARRVAQNVKDIEISRLLGWTRGDHTRDRMNDTAMACNAAHKLISGGYMSRDDLHNLSVRAAIEITGRAQSRMEQLEALGKKTQRPAHEIETAKKQIARGAKRVAKDFRENRHGLGIRDLKGQVDLEAYKSSRDTKRQSPLFAMFGDAVADSISKMLTKDTNAEKLAEIVRALPKLELEEDAAALRKIDFALAELGEHVAPSWRKKLAPKGKVVPFKLLSRQ